MVSVDPTNTVEEELALENQIKNVYDSSRNEDEFKKSTYP